jgi:hypothetical protein
MVKNQTFNTLHRYLLHTTVSHYIVDNRHRTRPVYGYGGGEEQESTQEAEVSAEDELGSELFEGNEPSGEKSFTSTVQGCMNAAVGEVMWNNTNRDCVTIRHGPKEERNLAFDSLNHFGCSSPNID